MKRVVHANINPNNSYLRENFVSTFLFQLKNTTKDTCYKVMVNEIAFKDRFSFFISLKFTRGFTAETLSDNLIRYLQRLFSQAKRRHEVTDVVLQKHAKNIMDRTPEQRGRFKENGSKKDNRS